MKNKAVTYLLIIIVAIVWGVIIYRVFDATNGVDNPIAIHSAPLINKEPLESYSDVKDTTQLLLNYRDPFAGEVKTQSKIIPVSKLISNKPALKLVTKPAINWTFISYSGYIKNSKSKKILTIVMVNGKAHTMMEGETSDGVKLVKNMVDSIKVIYSGTPKYIVMNIK